MKRISAEEHAARLALYRAGCNDCEIARQRGVMPDTICKWRNSNGLHTHNPSRTGMKELVEADIEAGFTNKQISERRDCVQSYVRATRQRMDHPERTQKYKRNQYARHKALITGADA